MACICISCMKLCGESYTDLYTCRLGPYDYAFDSTYVSVHDLQAKGFGINRPIAIVKSKLGPMVAYGIGEARVNLFFRHLR
jgi:hypothetical protein